MGKLPRNNPFACASNSLRMHTIGVCCHSLLATYKYEVQNKGGKIIFNALSGYSSANLKFYKWMVYDAFGNNVGGVLDLDNRTAPVEINTTSLSSAGEWEIKFSASEQVGPEEANLAYSIKVGSISSNPEGNSTPSNYENVKMLLKLTSTNDLNFSMFPVEGVEISNGSEIDLVNYLDSLFATKLANGASYIFSLEANKQFYDPAAELPSGNNSTVIASSTPEASYPILLEESYTKILGAITIKTDTAGIYEEQVTTLLTNEDVQPEFYFNLKTNVA